MDKYFMWIHYERLHNHNKAKHNKTVCIFLGIYCVCVSEVDITRSRHLRSKRKSMLIPKLDRPFFSRILDDKNTPFSVEITDFDVQ